MIKTVLATFKKKMLIIAFILSFPWKKKACSFFGPIHGDMVPSHPDLKRAATFFIQQPDGNIYAAGQLSDLSSVETGHGLCIFIAVCEVVRN